MAHEIIRVGDRTITPLISYHVCLGRPLLRGRDSHGEFIACRLGDQRTSKLYGWYVFVSPEDWHIAKNYTWCGRLDVRTGSIEVRRREQVGGKNYSIQLGHEIWERFNPPESKPSDIFRLGHPLDFRRHNLSNHPIARQQEKVLRGVINHAGKWQVQICIVGKTHYIGRTDDVDEGYRMYNRHLQKLKGAEPTNRQIQAIPYNTVAPQF